MKTMPDWWMPTAWPIFWRRAFILTLPISGSLWLTCMAVGGLAFMLFVMAITPIFGLVMLWEALWRPKIGDRR